jgi:CheY-like chemotaxis protein
MILLVEDNEDDEALMILALRKGAIATRIVVARTGEDAIVLLLGDDTQRVMAPTLVLLDLNLPKIDGHEVLRRIRSDKRTRYLPVVVFTSSNEDKDVVASYALGANSHVRKPVCFAEFVDAVRVLGPFWLDLNLVPPKHGAPRS